MSSDKFSWGDGDLVSTDPDDTREQLEDAHGRLFPDEDTTSFDIKKLATDILNMHGVIPDPNASEDYLVGQALGFVKERK